MSVKEGKIYNYVYDNKINIEEIMKDYNSYIKTIIKNSSVKFSNEDQEEILLDVYLTIWNNQKKIDINKNITPYIAGITKNLIRKKAEKLKNEYNIDDYEETIKNSISVEGEYEIIERRKNIITTIKKMKDEDKEIFINYYYKQFKIKEIAIIQNISEAKVKTKLFRIRKKIRKLLKEEEI